MFDRLDQLDLIGMSTCKVNDLVDDFIVNDLQARPASKGQYGYAYALNASTQLRLCATGLPSDRYLTKLGTSSTSTSRWRKRLHRRFHETHLLGECHHWPKLVQVTYEAMWKGIKAGSPRRPTWRL